MGTIHREDQIYLRRQALIMSIIIMDNICEMIPICFTTSGDQGWHKS